MAAKDYIIAEGFTNLYFAKRRKNPHLMSEDRRIIEDEECMCIAHYYLRKKCKELNTDKIVIKDGDGNDLYEMKLLKKEE